MATPTGLPPYLPPFLIGTLQQRLNDLFGEAEREEAADVERAGVSRGAYEQLATAPVPQVDPVAGGIQQLFGDMASVVSRRPEHSERSREDLKARNQMLLQQRMQNIQILRDRYVTDAAKIGQLDPVRALKLQESAVRLDKALEDLSKRDALEFGAAAQSALQTQGDEAAMARTRVQADTDLEIARMRTGAETLKLLGDTSITLSPDDYQKHVNNLQALYRNPKTKQLDKKAAPSYLAGWLGIRPPSGTTEAAWTTAAVNEFKAAKGKTKLAPHEVAQIQEQRAIYFPAPATESEEEGGDETVLERPAEDPTEALAAQFSGLSYNDLLRRLGEMRRAGTLPPGLDVERLIRLVTSPPAPRRLGGFAPLPSDR